MSITLYLDIDGVIAPLHSLPDSYRTLTIQSSYVTWKVRHTIATWIHGLPERNVRIVWASTWGEMCHDMETALHLPPCDYVVFPDACDTEQWVKFAAVTEHMTTHNNFSVWVDDEFDENTRQWASGQSSCAVVPCDPRTGLTYHDVSLIESYVC